MRYISEEEYKIGLKNGLKKSTIYMRVYRYDWDIEKAITTPPTKREYKARKYPKKYTDLALENGICLITFYARVRKGWSLEDAATVKLLTNRKTGGKKYASSNI